MKPGFLLVFLLTGTASAGGLFSRPSPCEARYQPPNIPALRSALAQARQKWAGSHIQNYRYTVNYGYSMEVSGKNTVTVRGGKVQGRQTGQTMEQLFAELDRRMNQAAAPGSCVMVEAEYSTADGHILSASWENTEKGLVDAFGGYTLTQFRVEK